MKTKTKKLVRGRIARLAASGEIKEIVVKEDLIDPDNITVDVCFRGDDCAGIIELKAGEIETIQKELSAKKKLLGKTKVIRARK